MILKKKYGGIIKNSCRKVSHIPNIPLHVLVPWCQRWEAGNHVIVSQTPITDQWPTFSPFCPNLKRNVSSPVTKYYHLSPSCPSSLFVSLERIYCRVSADTLTTILLPSVHIYIYIYMNNRRQKKHKMGSHSPVIIRALLLTGLQKQKPTHGYHKSQTRAYQASEKYRFDRLLPASAFPSWGNGVIW